MREKDCNNDENTFNINSIFYKANISGKKIWAKCQYYGLQKTYRKCLSFDITTNNPKRKEIREECWEKYQSTKHRPATKDGERQITKDICQKHHEPIRLSERRLV